VTVQTHPPVEQRGSLGGLRGFAVCFVTGCLFGLPDRGFPRSLIDVALYVAAIAMLCVSDVSPRRQGLLKLIAFAPWAPYLAWVHPRTGFFLWTLWLGWAVPCLAFAWAAAGPDGAVLPAKLAAKLGELRAAFLEKLWPKVGWLVPVALIAALAHGALELVPRLPLLRDGVVARGTVVGFDPADIVLPEVRFVAPDGRSFAFISQLKSHGLDVGSQVEVLHLPSDPTIAEVRDSRLWFQPLLSLLFAVGFAAGVFYVALVRWRARFAR
jgi:hypothetical protein